MFRSIAPNIEPKPKAISIIITTAMTVSEVRVLSTAVGTSITRVLIAVV